MSKRLLNEAELRAKVVDEWLRDHGFGPSDIILEKHFEIQLGRGIHCLGKGKRYGRSDYLVRSVDGRNLFVIETKAPSPDNQLDAAARDQVISYARLLRDGIAPFAILTNGEDTIIYDTLTGEALSDVCIPVEHPYVRSGFCVSLSDYSLRAEALERLISLTPENLLAFCRSQVAERMRPLRGEGIWSGLKYIPELYVDRPDRRKELEKILDHQNARCVFVCGRPQVGKTNFLCDFIERRLRNGKPCLFFPAIGMRAGICEEIRQDFEESFHDSSSAHQIIANKLQRVLAKNRQQLLICIDAWNEADLEVASSLGQECARLCSDQVQFVITFTTVAARRLLLDPAGNPTPTALAAGVERKAVPLLELEPTYLEHQSQILFLPKYEGTEIVDAYSRYASAFNVQVPAEHARTDDPLLLRRAMETYHRHVLPLRLDEADLLAKGLNDKFDRAVGLTPDSGQAHLIQVARALIHSDSPCYAHELCVQEVIPNCLFEAGLLFRRRTDDGRSLIDFYYERERDFVIAFWVRDWKHRLDKPLSALMAELTDIGRSMVGREALRWFLSKFASPEILSNFLPHLHECDPPLKLAILEALCQIASETKRWSSSHAAAVPISLASDSDLSVRIAYAKLITLQEDSGELESFFTNHYSIDLLRELLEVEDEYPLSEGSAGQIIIRALQSYSWLNGDDGEVSILADDLSDLLSDHVPSVRIGAAKAFGTLDPESFFERAAEKLHSQGSRNSDLTKEELNGGIHLAIAELGERYWGSMCPGMLSADDPEIALEEYRKLKPLVAPLLRAYRGTSVSEELRRLLKDVKPERLSRKINSHSLQQQKKRHVISASIQPTLFE